MIKKSATALSVVLLTGCVWSFSDAQDFVMTDKGLGELTHDTDLSQDMIAEKLGDRYHLLSGFSMKGELVRKTIQARQDGVAKLNFYADEKGKLGSIESFDKNVSTKKMSIGSKFSKLYKKAFGSCELGSVSESRTEVDCLDPKMPHIRYTFSGEWKGPADLIPSDDVLKSWTVTKITWFSR